MADLPLSESVRLPDTLEPSGGRGVSDGPAVTAVHDNDRVWLLDASGNWTSSAYPEEVPSKTFNSPVALSPDGRRVVVIGLTALWWRDVETQAWSNADYPPAFQTVYDFTPAVETFDDGRILLGQYDKFWLVDPGVDGGAEVTRLPFDEFDQVVAGGDDVVALDCDGLTTLAFLPLPTKFSYYADNGGISPVGWLDPDTLLAKVRLEGDPDTTWLVTWNVETGKLSRVSSYSLSTAVAFAIGAL